MREKVIRVIGSLLLGVLVMYLLLHDNLSDIQAWIVALGEQEKTESEDIWFDEPQTESVTEEQQYSTNLVLNDTQIEIEEENQMQLRLTLPKGVSGTQIRLENYELTQTLRIEIPHTDDEYYQSSPIAGSSDHIVGMSYVQKKGMDVIEIVLDKVYEIDTEYDESYYYLDFVDPHERYDHVVVIDAGHGGKDGGAEKYGILEKDIDLGIVLALKELFEASNEQIKVYYTRTTDSNPGYAQRVGLANKANADLFISIHNNSYKRSSSVSGTQVMYSQSFEGTFTSKRLAEICMQELTQTLETDDKGLLEGDHIYIIKYSNVPVALIEVGFMTNWEELNLLNSEEYQKKAAEGIYQAILRALEEAEMAKADKEQR